jgi:hypothetical protein
MKKIVRLLGLIAGLVASPAVLLAQQSFVMVTPGQAHLLVGESRVFRLVDQNGGMQHNVSWSFSDLNVFEVQQGDELFITAKEPGHFRIKGTSTNGLAEASITVEPGTSLREGTAIWSAPEIEGCKSVKITPAVPSPSGVDIFDQTQCADGQYISAYTSEGILVWRRKIGEGAAPVPSARPLPGNKQMAGNKQNVLVANRLNPRAASVCDSVTVGTDKEAILDQLKQRGLSFSEANVDAPIWTVEESGVQCKLSFDDKAVLARKTKIFITQ